MNRSMVTISASALVGAGLLAVVWAAGGRIAAPTAGHGAASRGVVARVPVLVELFTSEGCSSCPSADRVLAGLQKDQPVANAQIIALSEHVDYWNYIGWADPFSSRAFSDRQRAYGGAFRLDSVYTPQMVVNGQTEFVGSDRDRAVAAIERARNTARAEVVAEIVRSNGSLPRLQIRVDNLPATPRGDQAEVMLAIAEDNLHSNVSRGENAGRALAHTAVVRQLRTLGIASPGQSFKADPELVIERVWKPADLSAVVFVQERRSRRIVGAAAVQLSGTASR